MEFLVPGGLVLITVLGCLASCGWDQLEMRNRESWHWTGMLLLEIAFMPNVYMAAILAVFTFGLFQIGRSWFVLRTLVMPVTGLAGAYILLAGLMRPWMIEPVLWALVFVGCVLGAWGTFSWWHHHEYRYLLPKQLSWFGYWGIYEYEAGTRATMCGQGNMMHLLAIQSLAIAAATGLALGYTWWALLAIPLCLVPMYMCHWSGKGYPHSGVMYLAVIGLGVLLLWWPIVAEASAVLIVLGVVAFLKPWRFEHGWMDSGRFLYWRDALLVWWRQGWRVRLLGFGTGTWFLATASMIPAQRHPRVFTAAHNEYVQQLVEHGMLGLVVLCAYLIDALWRTSQAGAPGAAVFLVGLVLCAVATVNFNWTMYHEYHPRNTDQEQWFGSPSHIALAFVIAVLAEGV